MAESSGGTAYFTGEMKRKKKRGFFGWCFLIVLLIGGLAAGVVIYANLTAVWASHGRLFTEVDQLPKSKVGLVFGTTDKVNGNENPYFRYRIDAAVRVWKAGKIDTLIVSGDNRSRYYNEPEKMRQALVERGVPGERIVSDYAGLRTLDSVVRAKEIFGATDLLFISQRFQNQRAIYLAKANGIDARGFNAQDVMIQSSMKTKVREIGARVKMWLDVNFLSTRPKHLGEKVELPTHAE
ncbi:MAG: ElyC/SanA/YdcF family protein [Luteolibacter sp.]